MEHPFISSLSDKTIEELQSSISDLTKKLNFAYRMQNSSMINQLNMVMDSYKAEYGRKMDEMLTKQSDRTKINIQKES
jgi:predicted Zn-dependent protease